MGNLGNKETMAANIRYYMAINNVTSTEMCKVLGVPSSTFSYWTTAKTYPRIDKIEKMANYFGISKSDLVEERKEKAPLSEREALLQKISEKLANLSPDQMAQVLRYAQFLQSEQEDS